MEPSFMANGLAWANMAALLAASFLFVLYYVRSVSPAGLEQIIGSRSYRLCFRYRVIASIFETITVVNYILYYFFPLPVPLPRYFPWPWWVSGLIAVLIGAPTLLLMAIGLRHAGAEAIRPSKEHTMYGGIYTKIRHPQAVGEVFGWLVVAFLLHSPFLALFSLIYFPIFLLMCWAEEQDLLLRYGDSYAEYCRRTGAFWPKRGDRHA